MAMAKIPTIEANLTQKEVNAIYLVIDSRLRKMKGLLCDPPKPFTLGDDDA
jgi:hypothetical protein